MTNEYKAQLLVVELCIESLIFLTAGLPNGKNQMEN